MPNTSGTNREQLRKLLLITVAIASAIILAAGLARLQLHPGRSFPLLAILEALTAGSLQISGGLSLPAGVMQLITGCLWILFFISIIGFIISPEIRKGVLRRVIIYLFWFLLFYSLVQALQTNLPNLQTEPQGPGEVLPAELTDPTELMPTPPEFVVDPPQWIVAVVTVILIAILLGLAWLLWRFLVRPKKGSTALEQLTFEAQQTLAELEAGGDLKDTVMRCYYDMSLILSKQYNFHRAAGMTAREFEVYLAESGLQDEHIKRLTRLFEQFRYGQTATKKQDEEEAISCLAAIVQVYGQPLS